MSMSLSVISFMSMSDFPNKLNELRRAKKLSQADLGALAGCSAMQISRLEKGVNELTISWMRRLAPFLDCAPADLLLEQDNPMRLTPDERALIERYRNADENEQGNLQRVAEALIPYKSHPIENAA